MAEQVQEILQRKAEHAAGAGEKIQLKVRQAQILLDELSDSDGALDILTQALELDPGADAALVLLERIGERAEGKLRGEIVARIAHPLPTDNFEGLAAVHQPDGGTDLWLISDDNDSMFQRTLLLKLSLPADF